MHCAYGAADGNAHAAQRLYVQRFPNRRVPDPRLFTAIHRSLRETGSLEVRFPLARSGNGKCDFKSYFETRCIHFILKVRRPDGRGRQRTVRTPEFEEEALGLLESTPSTSSRCVAREMGASHVTIWRVWHEDDLYPYRLQKVQALKPDDFPRRIEFCQWFLQKCVSQPEFPNCVLFTDEASFTREGMFNGHNQHVWARDNPHAAFVRGHQDRFAVNIWAGLVGDNLVGPYMFPRRLNANTYLTFLRETLPELLEHVPLNVRQQMWYQHDGASAHFAHAVRMHLDATFGENWIGRNGPVAWPARSPDLTPIDFFFWGHLKSVVYETPVETDEELIARIMAASDAISTLPGVFERVRQSLQRRCTACIQAGGRTFEHFL